MGPAARGDERDSALRFPSALCGIALVPVAYLVGERLVSRRTGWVLAALVAVNPLLVYYSQEARGYSAVALLCGVRFAVLPRRGLRGHGGSGRGCGGTLASAVAIAVHYCARRSPVAVEALVLVARRRREALPALAEVAVQAAALAPLALHQTSGGSTADNVTAGVGLAERAKAARRRVGWSGARRGDLQPRKWLIGALLVPAVALLVVRATRESAAPRAWWRRSAAARSRSCCCAAVGGADSLNKPQHAAAARGAARGARGRDGRRQGASAFGAALFRLRGPCRGCWRPRWRWRAGRRSRPPVTGAESPASSGRAAGDAWSWPP